MKKFVIEFGAKEFGAALACALVFGGGFATVQSFTGVQTMQFKLYSDTSGTAFWTSDPRDVDVVGGKFAVTLGDSYDSHKLEAQDFRHAELYVELMVDGTTLNPRQRIAPVGQAITAAQAAGDFRVPGAVRVDGALATGGDVVLGDAQFDTTTVSGQLIVHGPTMLDSVSVDGAVTVQGGFEAATFKSTPITRIVKVCSG